MSKSLSKGSIITHPGSAHFDEFFALSLILSLHQDTEFTIERRDPTPDELANPDIWVVDIGEKHQPELKNFDHHQDITLCASFVLVADFLNLTPSLSMLPWWEFKDKIDRFGPVKTGKEIGTDKLRITYSPFESWFLTLFSETPNDVTALMRAFGHNIINEANSLSRQFNYWKQCKTVQVKGKTVIIGETENSDGAQEYNSTLSEPAAVIITHDSRGEGWKLCRFDNFPEVDFSKLSGHPDIKFAHKTGFVAKTYKRLPLEKLLDFIEKAI